MGSKKFNSIFEYIDNAVAKAFEAGMKAGYEKKRLETSNYFKSTEKLLYSYPNLKLKVAQDELDIKDLERERYTERSKDIVKLPKNRAYIENYQAELIESRKASMERTKKEIERIERALDRIKDDEGYEIIEMKYFKQVSTEEIAEKIEVSESTIKRWKNRLINKLSVLLFGLDALKF